MPTFSGQAHEAPPGIAQVQENQADVLQVFH